jgi:CRISPR-associated exonuclease Cas4
METDILDTDSYLRINEIKNYLYCPRISYYSLCLQVDRETDLSRGGIVEEQQTKEHMKRRKYALHAVHEGSRHFDVPITSHLHRFVGRLDEMVVTSEGAYLVDYKDTDQDYGYWRTQMLAYKLGLEEMGQVILGCYVYLIPKRAYELVVFKASDINKLAQILSSLRGMVAAERCPPPAAQIGKCRSCQYLRFCNDVL